MSGPELSSDTFIFENCRIAVVIFVVAFYPVVIG